MTDEYIMGRTSSETERLQIQGRLFAPYSAHLLRMAGIALGMRVLDVGCGAGDVSLLLAEAVGPDGRVTGVDVDPGILALARAVEAGLANVSFCAGDLADLRLEAPVDAVVGRLIRLHVKDPAATVRALSRLVHRGGDVSGNQHAPLPCGAGDPARHQVHWLDHRRVPRDRCQPESRRAGRFAAG
jgi:ubiquinone/menaquinone biosynthesis C-methylase UbiE